MKRNNIFFLYHPFLFSLVFPAMINFFKRNTSTHACHQHQYPGLGLGLATRDVDRPPNVLESAMLRPNHVNNGLLLPTKVVNSLTCCTESLGFESSDGIDNNVVNDCDEKENRYYDEAWMRRRNMMKEEERGRVRSYPPPISSLNRNGKPSFYLRPVRKDGRLELTEVRIQRSEILHAWRHDGRLTLHLVPDSEEEEEEEEIEEVEEEIEGVEEEQEWRLRGVGGSEGLRRCHEMVVKQHQHQHHHHHHLRMCGISIV